MLLKLCCLCQEVLLLLHSTAQHNAQVQSHTAGLPLPQFVLSGTHPTRIQSHQLKELSITEGLAVIQKSNARM